MDIIITYEEFKQQVIDGINKKWNGNTLFQIRECYIEDAYRHRYSLEDAIRNVEKDSIGRYSDPIVRLYNSTPPDNRPDDNVEA
jgi:hypothetical protein